MELQPVQIQITNFQSIAAIDFEVFGFTAITGRSNVGKSAIMRAISRSIMNDPVVNMVRRGEKFVTVELKSDKWGYKWEKGDSNGINRYIIGDRILDKTGQVQLPEIKEMGFGSIRIGDDDIHPWWASQFDPIFLLNKSGPQVTDFITEVSGLKVLQNAIVHAARLKKRNNDVVKIKEIEIKKVKDHQSRIGDVEKLDVAENQLSEQLESIELYEKRIREMNYFITTLKNIGDSIDRLSDISTVKIPKINADVESSIEKILVMHGHWVGLEAAAKSIIPIKGIKKVVISELPDIDFLLKMASFSDIPKLKQSVSVLSDIDKVPFTDLSDIKNSINDFRFKQIHFTAISEASKAVKSLEKIEEVPKLPELPEFNLKEMQNHLTAIKLAKKLVQDSEEELKTVNEELKFVNQELAKIPVCPACQRPIAENHETHGA